MPFRGWLSLNGAELVNSSRTRAHIDPGVVLTDDDLFGPTPPLARDCGLVMVSPGLAVIPEGCEPVSAGLRTIPPGARRYSQGLIEVGECGPEWSGCACPGLTVQWDDTWDGLPGWLGDDPRFYRPELAPWYSTRIPEAGEFLGLWLTSAKGFDATPVDRALTELVGAGSAAGRSRDTAATLVFEALVVGCSNAGAQFGVRWLAARLREAANRPDSVLRFLAAHPGGSAVNPADLVREYRNVVLTKTVEVVGGAATGGRGQASVYRVSWEMVAASPYRWLPPVDVQVEWDEVNFQPINWVHDTACTQPASCSDMPVLFSTECPPEEIPLTVVDPPVCGGCLPVDGLQTHVFRPPTFDWPVIGHETAVTVKVRNTGNRSLSLQAFWRPCGTDVRCDAAQFPVTVAGLRASAGLVLDGVTGRFHALYDGRRYRPRGVVGTPTGAPWRPPLIDRSGCWEFVVQTAPGAEFAVELTLRDREP